MHAVRRMGLLEGQFLYINLGLLSTLVFVSIVLLRCHMYLSPAHRMCVWQGSKLPLKLCFCLLFKVSILRELSQNCAWDI